MGVNALKLLRGSSPFVRRFPSLPLVGSVALLVARRTNNQPTIGRLRVRGLLKVVCITELTGNRMGVNCPLWPATTPSSEL